MKLFLGCVIPNRLPFLEASSRKAFEKLGIETSDAPFSCCPDPVGFQTVSQDAWLAMGARNLALAESEGKDIVSLCNGCTQTLVAVNHELKHDEDKKAEVNEVLKKVNKSYNGGVKVKHFVEALAELGVDKIKNAVTKQLSNLKVACHPGCHFFRPSKIMNGNTQAIKDIVAATGATVIDYSEEELCCGNGATNTVKETGDAIAKKKIDSAKAAGANVLCVVCPACFQQLDTKREIPIVYLTELLALAMGETFDSLNMKFHAEKSLKNIL